ncbi:MAG: hypothetical protein JWQ38_1286 [Flavipsychrobacter sp.]|nr:hypothetical protein [Flavipsychrobacter sp.]
MNRNVLMCITAGIALLASAPTIVKGQNISTIAGSGIGDNGAAATCELMRPTDATVDAAGNIYIIENSGGRIRKIDGAGIATTIAGNSRQDFSGDGGPATAAAFSFAKSIAMDRHGNIYIADQRNDRIRMINTSGIINTIAGGTTGYSGDGGPATDAELFFPNSVIVDSMDNVYISDMGNSVIRMISPSGTISTIAGTGSSGYNGDGIAATAADLSYPTDIAVDKAGNLYIADEYNSRIRMVSSTTGIITTVAGTGTPGFSGDSGPATAADISFPASIAIDTAGNIIFTDEFNARIRSVATSGIITTIAGNGTSGYSGDGGSALAANLGRIPGIATDIAGNVYLADQYNNKLRKVSTTGTITGIAGRNGIFGDGPALQAQITVPYNIATDDSGNVYIPDTYNSRIRKITPSGIVTTVAGSGFANASGYSGDGGPATDATIWDPYAVAVDKNGNLYIADYMNSVVRKVNTSGIITTFAGGSGSGYSGDHGPATDAQLFDPCGIAVDDAGNVYIADEFNYAIRKVDTHGIITTIAGKGVYGYSGDGGPAQDAQLQVSDVAVDKYGTVYIADGNDNVIRAVDTMGIIRTIAGDGTFGYSGDGGPATAATFRGPGGIKTDRDGNIYISDCNNNRIRMINTSGIISTIAGNGVAGYSGDGGSATSAQISGPSGVAIDGTGNIYIADGNNFRVRKITKELSVPGIDKHNLTNIAVYPNPATNTIVVTNTEGCTLTLYDAAGRQVMTTNEQHNMTVMDLKSLPAGSYLLHATNKNGITNTARVTKQ